MTLGLALFFAFMLNVGGRRRKGAADRRRAGLVVLQDRLLLPAGAVDRDRRPAVPVRVQPDDRARSTRLLKAVGLDSLQPDWLGDPEPRAVVRDGGAGLGTVGFFVVLFSAGMASIPKDFYEAALLDGASRITTFFRITLPLLWDTVQSGWVYMGILALGAEAFAAVQIMTVGPGGPDVLDHRPAAVRLPDGLPRRAGRLRDHDRCRPAHRHAALRGRRDAARPARAAGVLMRSRDDDRTDARNSRPGGRLDSCEVHREGH